MSADLPSTPYSTGRLQFVGNTDDLGVRTFAMSFWPALPMGTWQEVAAGVYFPLAAALQLTPVDVNPGDEFTIWFDGDTLFFGEIAFAGGAPGQWLNTTGDGLWDTAGNWSGDAVPTSTIDVIMGGVTNAACVLPDNLQECKTLDLTGYTGSIHVAASDNCELTVFGDATLDGACTTPGYIKLTFMDDATLITDAFPRVFAVNEEPGTTVTLGDNLNCFELDGTEDTVYALGNFDIIFSDASEAAAGGLFTDSSADMTFGTGRIRVTATDPVYFEGDGGTGVWAPIIVASGSAGIIADASLTCFSYLQSDGDLTTDGATLTVAYDFIATGGTITNAIVSVGGASCLAANATITNADFSGGTELNAADNCVDGGGNTNVDFGVATSTSWTNGDGDNLWSNPLNWSDGVPSATTDVSFDASNDNCDTTGASPACKSIDFTGYTGDITDGGSEPSINVSGDITGEADICSAANIFFYVLANCTFTANGLTNAYIECDDDVGLELTIAQSCSMFELDAGCVLHLGSSVITFIGYGCYIYDGTIDYTAGAKFIFDSPFGSAFECDGGGTAPPVEHVSGNLSIPDALCESFTQLGGRLSQGPLETTGDFDASGGSMLNVTGIVGGTGTAADMPITGCNFSGGSTLDATDNCLDLGGNTGITFANTHWTNGGADNDWANAANWTNGVPDATKDACFIAADSVAGCTIPAGPAACRNMILVDYTGTINTAGALLATNQILQSSGYGSEATIQNGGTFTLTGDMTMTSANLSSLNLTVAGNLDLTDVALNAVIADITGTAVARSTHSAAIFISDFSGGTALNATDGMADGGGNTNVNF